MLNLQGLEIFTSLDIPSGEGDLLVFFAYPNQLRKATTNSEISRTVTSYVVTTSAYAPFGYTKAIDNGCGYSFEVQLLDCWFDVRTSTSTYVYYAPFVPNEQLIVQRILPLWWVLKLEPTFYYATLKISVTRNDVSEDGLCSNLYLSLSRYYIRTGFAPGVTVFS